MTTAVCMTAFERALRFVGVAELAGNRNHPLVQWWFSLCGYDPETPDEVPWCSVFVNGIAWDLRLPRSKSAAARSWLGVGRPILLGEARPEHDVVVLQRGDGEQPGPDVLKAPGHVGFYAGTERTDATTQRVMVLGGNQSNAVNVASFSPRRVLGVRRLLG